MRKKILIPMIMGILLASSGTAFAKSACSENAARAIGQSSINAQQADAKKYKDILDAFSDYEKLKQQDEIPGMPGVSAKSCMDAWPKGNFGFSLPSIDDVINGVADAAIKKACDAARSQISKATSGLSSGVYLNTGIPGMPQIGANGSLGTGSSPGLDINGSGSGGSAGENAIAEGWNQISGLFQ